MNLAKIKLITSPGNEHSSTDLHLLLKGKGKRIVTGYVLHLKQPKIRELTREEPFADGFILLDEKPYKLMPGAKYLAGKRKNKPVIKPIPRDAGVLIVKRISAGALSEEQRERIAGMGEKGELRRQFVEEALTAKEQRHRAEEHTALMEAEWSRKTRAKKRERRKLNAKRTDNDVGPTEETVPTDAIYGAGDVAKLAGLESSLIRRFLRSKGIGKRGGRYLFKKSEAEKIARAAKKHYKEED